MQIKTAEGKTATASGDGYFNSYDAALICGSCGCLVALELRTEHRERCKAEEA